MRKGGEPTATMLSDHIQISQKYACNVFIFAVKLHS